MTPEQERMYRDLMNLIYGINPSDERFDAEYYLSENPEIAAEINQRVDRYMKQGGDYSQKDLTFDPVSSQWKAPDGSVVANPFSPDRKQEIGKTRQELTEDFARQHWEETGKHKGLQGSAPREGDEASVVKPYRERLAEDIEYRKGVDTGYADRMGGLREDYLSELGNSFVDRQRANKMYGRRMKGVTDDLVGTIRGATEDWRQGAGEMKQAVKPLANRAPVNVSLGGFSMPFTTGS
jgi:hypothetical protein